MISDLFVSNACLYKLQLRLEGVEHRGVGELAECYKIKLFVVLCQYYS